MIETTHSIIFGPAQKNHIKDESVNLVVTSPPYPMIEMWDECFSAQNPTIGDALFASETDTAFELMHKELDAVWKECFRVLTPGGFLCINIGDATRTFNGEFRLYNNHSRITQYCLSLGFINLPNIIWHKPTNAPNKFMGSGMLPCGAYVTLEHEYILVFRKGNKRQFKQITEKESRRQSAFFWEERNIWFSDVWDFVGTKQKMVTSDSRDRSAAFPLEVPYRLINMYSQYGDMVMDPFYGLGTTTQAAMLLGRNSIGYEIDAQMRTGIVCNLQNLGVSDMNKLILARYKQHLDFVEEYSKRKGGLKHFNSYLACNVVTSQEESLELHYLTSIDKNSGTELTYTCHYEESSNMNVPPVIDALF